MPVEYFDFDNYEVVTPTNDSENSSDDSTNDDEPRLLRVDAMYSRKRSHKEQSEITNAAKNEVEIFLSVSGTETEKAIFLVSIFCGEFWDFIRVHDELRSKNIPLGLDRPITAANLNLFGISFYVASSKIMKSKEDIVEKLFNLDQQRSVTKAGMQGWRSLKYLQLAREITLLYSPVKMKEFLRELVVVLRSCDFTPGFECNGKYWVIKRNNDQRSIKLFSIR